MKNPKLILFEVYETLLDTNELAKKVNSVLNSRRAYTIWAHMYNEYCFALTCINKFDPPLSTAKATLKLTADELKTRISEEEADNLVNGLFHLPIYDDVQEGLSELNRLGYRLAALTNFPLKVRERMDRTGLISYFEMVLSAEEIKRYKPAPETYKWAAATLNVEPADILLVTSYSWDIMGGLNAGMQVAWLNNLPLYPIPGGPITSLKTMTELPALLVTDIPL